MKNNTFNLLGSLIAFYIPVQIAYLTGSESVIKAVLLAFLIQWICFIPAYILQTEKFYDLTGSVTYLTLIMFSIFSAESLGFASVLVCACVSVWAVRLGSFLFFRIKKDGEDKRFRSIKSNFTRFFMTWTLQGMWVTMCLLCVTTALSADGGIIKGLGFYLGLIVFIIGFSLEVAADMQKTKFRKTPENKNRFISTGLWAKSRHPNYLGEIVIWVGVFVMSIPVLHGLQFLSILSPIFVYFLLTRISGINLLEESADLKWGDLEDYKRYKKNTPILFPNKI